MNIEEFEQKALAHLSGKLNPLESQGFITLLEKDETLKQHFNELQRIWNAKEQDMFETPDESLRTGFYNMLHTEQEKSKTTDSAFQKLIAILADVLGPKPIVKFAMLLLVALVSGTIGFNLNTSSNQLESYAKQVNTLNMELANAQLKSASTSDRIQAITSLNSSILKEDIIIDKLVNKLLYDDNLHVRIAAGKSLLAFTDNVKVKPEIVTAIRNEKELLVQATLIDVLITIDREAAIKEIYKIFDNDSSSPELKTIYQSVLESENI